MREAFEVGPSAIFVTYRVNNLGRNAIDVQETLAALLDHKVRIVFLSDGIDSNGIGGAVLKLLVGVMASLIEMNEGECLQTRTERTQRVIAEAKIRAK